MAQAREVGDLRVHAALQHGHHQRHVGALVGAHLHAQERDVEDAVDRVGFFAVGLESHQAWVDEVRDLAFLAQPPRLAVQGTTMLNAQMFHSARTQELNRTLL